jgi:hypothetical protein
VYLTSTHAWPFFHLSRVKFQRDGNEQGLGRRPFWSFPSARDFLPRLGLLEPNKFIAPVKYPTLSLVILAAEHLTHPRICLSFSFRLQDRQEGPRYLSARDMRRHHRGHFGPGPERGFPGQTAGVHRGRGYRVGCRPGACVCGPGRPGGKTLDPPWRRAQRHLSDYRWP